MKTEKLIIADYVQMRDSMIDEILNVVKSVHEDNHDILLTVIDLTIELKCANPDVEFVQDLKGFMMWASMTQQDARSALTTIIHDLSEFSINRNEPWFCPRSFRYRKYLTGASTFFPS